LFSILKPSVGGGLFGRRSRGLLRGRSGGSGFGRGGVDEGLVDELEELAAVDDLDEGRALGVGGDDPDSGSMFDADALAERVIGLDQFGQLALGIDGEGQGEVAAGGKLFSEIAQDIRADDRGLIRKDLVAILVAQNLAVGVEPAA